MPAGSQADKDGPSAPVASGYWLGGRDKDLFTVVTTTPEGYPNHVQHDVVTARPLPAGEYRFNIHVLQPDILICGGWSEFVKNTGGTYVTVTAPSGTVHEAFFDPVAIAAAVGADGTNGVLKPAAFTVDGASATITSLKWESGVVTMEPEPLRVAGGTRHRFHRPRRFCDQHPVVRQRHAGRRRADVERAEPALERRRQADATRPQALGSHSDTGTGRGSSGALTLRRPRPVVASRSCRRFEAGWTRPRERRSSIADLRSGGVKEARTPFRVNVRRSSVPKPRDSASSYSRSMSVQRRTGSSVHRVTGTPASTRSRMGCSSSDGTAPRTTFDVRQHSTVTPESTTCRSSSSPAAAYTP